MIDVNQHLVGLEWIVRKGRLEAIRNEGSERIALPYHSTVWNSAAGSGMKSEGARGKKGKRGGEGAKRKGKGEVFPLKTQCSSFSTRLKIGDLVDLY